MATRLPVRSMSMGTLVDGAGNALVGHPVYVRQHGTMVAVPVYQDDTSSVTYTQPISTDVDGGVPGFLETPIEVDIVDANTGLVREQPYVSVDDLTAVWTTANAHAPAAWATAAALDACTYNGTARTLTANSNGTLSIDSHTPSFADRVLVKNQALSQNNGIYVVTVVGTSGGGGTKWVLTRATDMATSAQVAGAYLWVTGGTVNAGVGFIVAAPGPFTLGTTPIPWGQFAVPTSGISLLVANNLSDVADADLSRANLKEDVLAACKAVATTNISLTGTQTIDTLALSAGDRVLLTGQVAGAENGPWVVASGAWARPTDYSTGTVVTSRVCAVNGGASHSTIWTINSTANITVGTTATTWVKVAQPAAAKVVRSTHTFAVAGPIFTATGSADLEHYLPPFFVSAGANETVKLVKCRFVTGVGIVGFKLQKNGADITGFGTSGAPLSAGTTAASVAPTGVALAEDDALAVVVVSVASSPGNLSVTLVFERTVL